jgi:hypothetical protein
MKNESDKAALCPNCVRELLPMGPKQTQRPDAQIAEIVGNAWVLLVSVAVLA